MIVSPLQLESYFVDETHIVAQVEFVPPDTPEELAVRVQEALRVQVKLFDSEQDPTRRAVELSIALQAQTPNSIPYEVTLRLIGFFHLAPQYRPNDSAHHADLWNVNAPSVLYGIAREILASFTCRGPYPSICLPTVTFTEPAAETEPPALEEVAQDAPPKARKKRAKKAA